VVAACKWSSDEFGGVKSPPTYQAGRSIIAHVKAQISSYVAEVEACVPWPMVFPQKLGLYFWHEEKWKRLPDINIGAAGRRLNM